MVAAETPDRDTLDRKTQDMAELLRRMRHAQRTAGSPSCEQRTARLERLEQGLVSHKEALAEVISRDFGGRSVHETLFAEVFLVKTAIRHAKTHLREWMEPEERETEWVSLPARSQVIPQPVGVVGIIAPWNYPVLLALSPLVGALSAGNRAIVKPSELTPRTAELLREVLAGAFAEEEVAVVTGGWEVGEAMSRLPFDHLVFTGSTRVGKVVMRNASENLVPVTLELGGKSPAIVAADYRPASAATRILRGKVLNAGQTCIAPDYALLPRATRDDFVRACTETVASMYSSLANNPDYTSIINDRHYARLLAYLDDARTRGARIVELNPGSESIEALHAARKMAPTLVLDPTDDMLVMQEEIFGPILPIVTYETLDQAIEYIGDRPHPLALYCFSHQSETVDRVISQTLSGGVSVNETNLHIAQADLPFGGVGASGMGQYHGREGFDTFSKKRPIFRQSRFNTGGLTQPPYGKTLDRVLQFLIGG